MSEVVKCGLYADGQLDRELNVDELEDFECAEGNFVWVGIHEPTPELLRKVQKVFHLHDLAVEDALRAHQRPKIEEYGQSLFIVVRTARWNEQNKKVEYGETDMFVGSNYFVTVRHGPSAPYAEVRARAESVPHLLRKGPSYALYAVLDFMVDNYFPVFDQLEGTVEDLEDRLFRDDPNPRFTRRVYQVRRELGRFKRVVTPLLEVLARQTRADLKLVSDDIRPYFRDVYDHLVRINESLEQLRETVHSALEASLALISVKQNETMQMLAAWAAILAIPTVVAGVYGMNVDWLPGAHFLGGSPPIVGATLVACGLLYWRFKKSGWL
ncbi:MAG TPA: magnesium/cobalt transporter CorA [Candidatus Binatia bacterium]|nr:magnesium/cobalt transporter CorA [Candidatus Binatia bacterium]